MANLRIVPERLSRQQLDLRASSISIVVVMMVERFLVLFISCEIVGTVVLWFFGVAIKWCSEDQTWHQVVSNKYYGDLDYMHEYGWSDHGLACNWFKRYSGLCIKVAVGSSFLSW